MADSVTTSNQRGDRVRFPAPEKNFTISASNAVIMQWWDELPHSLYARVVCAAGKLARGQSS